MARAIARLTARKVATVTDKGRYADGGGLYLQVGDTGGKAWLYRYTLYGKARQMGLGALASLSLADARDKAQECRSLVREGTGTRVKIGNRLLNE